MQSQREETWIHLYILHIRSDIVFIEACSVNPGDNKERKLATRLLARRFDGCQWFKLSMR